MDDDAAIVEQQIGRPPRAFRSVAVRCPFGRPAVTEQRPFDDTGTPFPTQFWLTCPHLVAQIARLEGRIERADSGHVLVREARRLGLVKPGEQLYIVRGIPAWRQKH